MEKEIIFKPAWDKRSDNPAKNYGVHGVDLCFTLKGEEGAVYFVLFTNWHLPHIQKINDERMDAEFPHLACHPMPAELGYHSPIPQYEGQEISSDVCSYTGDKPCFVDSSVLNAKPIYKALLEEGDMGVWHKLEEYYNEIFKGEDK